jgi:hypothetical protein
LGVGKGAYLFEGKWGWCLCYVPTKWLTWIATAIMVTRTADILMELLFGVQNWLGLGEVRPERLRKSGGRRAMSVFDGRVGVGGGGGWCEEEVSWLVVNEWEHER